MATPQVTISWAFLRRIARRRSANSTKGLHNATNTTMWLFMVMVYLLVVLTSPSSLICAFIATNMPSTHTILCSLIVIAMCASATIYMLSTARPEATSRYPNE